MTSIKIISAGAGSGKTYTLTERIYQAINNGANPEKIMATTFTKKAAHELMERVRLKLLENGKHTEALRIQDAYIGTLNSVFGRIVDEFNYALGLSPNLNVLDEVGGTVLFNTVARDIFEKVENEHFDVLHRMQLLDDQNHWTQAVLSVVEAIRQNNFGKEEIQQSARLSVNELLALLPKTEQTVNIVAHMNDKIPQIQTAIEEIESQQLTFTKPELLSILLSQFPSSAKGATEIAQQLDTCLKLKEQQEIDDTLKVFEQTWPIFRTSTQDFLLNDSIINNVNVNLAYLIDKSFIDEQKIKKMNKDSFTKTIQTLVTQGDYIASLENSERVDLSMLVMHLKELKKTLLEFKKQLAQLNEYYSFFNETTLKAIQALKGDLKQLTILLENPQSKKHVDFEALTFSSIKLKLLKSLQDCLTQGVEEIKLCEQADGMSDLLKDWMCSSDVLRADFKQVIELVFKGASDVLEVYERQKKERGLIDFTDQEHLSLKLVGNPVHLQTIADNISHIYVDEFQDCNPLQIALITKLSEAIPNVTLVGDMKQAIYGFRGSDPTLMAEMLNKTDKDHIESLGISYRSDEKLVELVNELFVPAFAMSGLTEDLVKLKPNAARPKIEHKPEVLEVWQLEKGKNNSKAEQYESIARAIVHLIEHKEDYKILDKQTKVERKLEIGDIAILCATNHQMEKIARELELLNVPVKVGREGLLKEREIVYALAAYKLLLNISKGNDGSVYIRDSLALAELMSVSEADILQDSNVLKFFLQYKQEQFPNLVAMRHQFPQLDRFIQVSEKMTQMSPSEVLDFVLIVAEADEFAVRLGNAEQRLANLDKLRQLVLTYEASADMIGETATVKGFLGFLNELERSKQKNDRELLKIAESAQKNAVQIMTYHSAKGLEWPFVVLFALDRSSKTGLTETIFNQVNVINVKPFTLEKPLQGRAILYWPWPFGGKESNALLKNCIEPSNYYINRCNELREEHKRLLYVGTTRAREYVALADAKFEEKATSKIKWLNELHYNEKPVIASFTFPANGQQGEIELEGERKKPFTFKSFSEPPIERLALEKAENAIYVLTKREPQTYGAATFVPSEQSDYETTIYEEINLAQATEDDEGIIVVDYLAHYNKNNSQLYMKTIQIDEDHFELYHSFTKAGEMVSVITVENAIEDPELIQSYIANESKYLLAAWKKLDAEVESLIATLLLHFTKLNKLVIIERNGFVTDVSVVEIGQRIHFESDNELQIEMNFVGDLMHAFLGIDVLHKQPLVQRLELAERLRKQFNIHCLSATNIVEASNRLQVYIAEHVTDIEHIYTEYPIYIFQNGQKGKGWIDMLVETKAGWVIIDHKTFPGKQEASELKAISYKAQIEAYAKAIEEATNKPIIGVWIHMPIIGRIVQFDLKSLQLNEILMQ